MLRLLIIGLDGASYRIIKRFQDKLQTLRNLMKKSEYGVLRSITDMNTRVPVTGPAWMSLYTGLRSEEHGLTTDRWLKDNWDYGNVKKVTVWDLIQEKYSLGMMTMPITYPAFRLNGWMISGFPASKTFANWYYPSSLSRFVERNFSIDYVDRSVERLNVENFDEEKQEQITLQKIEKLKKIDSIYKTEVVSIGLTFLDKYGHVYPQYGNKHLGYIENLILKYTPNREIYFGINDLFNRSMDLLDERQIRLNGKLLAGYKKIDEHVKTLTDYFEPENLVICSDHGFRKYGFGHDVNGFYLLKGDEYKEGMEKKRNILDIAPNMLRMLDISTRRLGKDKSEEQMSSIDGISKKKIAEKLKALGYIE